MDRHRTAARISKNKINPLPLQRGDQNLSPIHDDTTLSRREGFGRLGCLGNFGLGLRGHGNVVMSPKGRGGVERQKRGARFSGSPFIKTRAILIGAAYIYNVCVNISSHDNNGLTSGSDHRSTLSAKEGGADTDTRVGKICRINENIVW